MTKVKDAMFQLLRYRTKEILGFLLIVTILYLLSLMVTYDKKNGFQLHPSMDVNVDIKKEVKP